MANDRQSGSPGGLYEQRIGDADDRRRRRERVLAVRVRCAARTGRSPPVFPHRVGDDRSRDRVRARGAGSAVHHARRGDPLPAAAGGNVHRIPRDDGQRPRRRLVREHLPGRLVYRLRRASRDRRVRNRPHAHRARGDDRPALSDPVYEDYERMQGEAAAATAERDETSAELASTREELDATESELSATNEELSETESALEAARAETAALRGSKARFELFEDAGGKPRWRLRHRNGNVIATAGQGGAAAAERHKRASTVSGGTRSAPGSFGSRPRSRRPRRAPSTTVPRARGRRGPERGRPERRRGDREQGDLRAVRGRGRGMALATPPRQREHHLGLRRGYASPSRTRSARSAGSASTSPPRTTSGRPDRLRGVPERRRRVALAAHPRERERARRLRRGYSSRSKARQGRQRVQSNAAEAALEAVGDDGVAGDADGNPNATFELYEDAAEEYPLATPPPQREHHRGLRRGVRLRVERAGRDRARPRVRPRRRRVGGRQRRLRDLRGRRRRVALAAPPPQREHHRGLRRRVRPRSNAVEGVTGVKANAPARRRRRSRRRSRSALTRTFFRVLLNSRSGRRQELQP